RSEATSFEPVCEADLLALSRELPTRSFVLDTGASLVLLEFGVAFFAGNQTARRNVFWYGSAIY
ncbi:MAG: hypothetical protein Q6L68_10295, partial [Thermostichus sp. DG02_5_bins_236]